MKCDEALSLWGKEKLLASLTPAQRKKTVIDLSTVKVYLDTEVSYSCCRNNPISFFRVEILGDVTSGKITKQISTYISEYDFDFLEFLKEIVEVADGTLTG